MTLRSWCASGMALFLLVGVGPATHFVIGQQQPAPTAPVAGTKALSQRPTSTSLTPTQRRARRRARRPAAQPTAPQTQQSALETAAQQQRDQKILEQQQAQSAEIARQNDAVNKKVMQEQQRQQAEPRIQDAPGPGAQILPGDPAIQPAQVSDPQGIHDAPGPAQTLPQPPPAAPAPAPQF